RILLILNPDRVVEGRGSLGDLPVGVLLLVVVQGGRIRLGGDLVGLRVEGELDDDRSVFGGFLGRGLRGRGRRQENDEQEKRDARGEEPGSAVRHSFPPFQNSNQDFFGGLRWSASSNFWSLRRFSNWGSWRICWIPHPASTARPIQSMAFPESPARLATIAAL